MKKFMKGCGITALVMIVVGVIMSLAVCVTKGTAFMNSFVDNATGGRISRWISRMEDRGIYVRDGYIEGFNDFDINDDFEGYDIEEASGFNNYYSVQNGDVDYNFSGTDVANLNVEMAGCLFTLEESSDNVFHVEARNAGKFQAYEEGETIYLKASRKTNLLEENKKCFIILYVPQDYSFSDITMALGAGVMNLEGLTAESMTLDVGAGQINADYLMADSLDISVGAGEVIVDDMDIMEFNASVEAGHLLASGRIDGNGTAECSAGSLELNLDAEETDYDYAANCVAGSIDIGENYHSWASREKMWSNGTGKLLDLECSLGQITVSFY